MSFATTVIESAETTTEVPSYCPKTPASVHQIDIPESLMEDIFLRRLYKDGRSSLVAMSDSMKVSISIVETLFHRFRHQLIIDVRGTEGEDYIFGLTEKGNALAIERMRVSEYAGAIPVSINEYTAACNAQKAEIEIDREFMATAFSDIVVTNDLLDSIGPAVISQKSIFLHGPSGNGKTTVAERLLRVYTDPIIVPYAVEVDGQIILTYEKGVHEIIDLPEDVDLDPRWLPCKRPAISVGGELTGDQLSLRHDDTGGFYSAPLQMKANNGMLLIDDFGRQVNLSAKELLNRWIVPLDRQKDYLSLKYGLKFEIPFQLMVVFSTNLKPSDLADDAFLRRIQNKIYISPVSDPVFDEIFERVATDQDIPHTADTARMLREYCHECGSKELRACYPRDICEILGSISKYEKTAITADPENLKRAARLYFTTEEPDESFD